jgi:bacteriocin biosynthesis cyclodehydratase domain-containing protein
VRLAAHHTVLPFGTAGRLIGLDPDTALAVEDLPPPLAEMIDEMRAPAPRHELVARAVERGAEALAAESLLHELMAAGAVVDAAGSERAAHHRAGSTAVVVGCGPLAVGIVAGLVHAGVGTVHTDTDGTVRAGDLGTGFSDADRGQERLAATRAAVRRLVPAAGTGPPPLRLEPDLVVLADEGPDPVRLAALAAARVAHLPARLRDGVGVVGPLVLPGRSTCLGCLELHRTARDPRWPAVAAQLVGRRGSAEPSCVTATAGLATAQALAALDGAGCGTTPPATLDATLELDVTGGTLMRRVWDPRPECQCRAASSGGGTRHGRATSGKHRDGDTIMG